VRNGDQLDTLSIRKAERPSGWDQMRLQQDKRGDPGNRSGFNPGEPIPLKWTLPLKTVHPESVQLWEDSTLLEDKDLRLVIDSADKRQLLIRFKWEENHPYRLVFLPGALDGWQEFRNDSLVLDYRIGQLKDFGSLRLVVDSLETEKAYVAELLQQDKLIRRFPIAAGLSKWEIKLEGLPAATYQLRLIEDLNANVRWDPGRYDQKLQPERLLLWSIEPLRASWEVEANFVLIWE
jgi:hypothetical protein